METSVNGPGSTSESLRSLTGLTNWTKNVQRGLSQDLVYWRHFKGQAISLLNNPRDRESKRRIGSKSFVTEQFVGVTNPPQSIGNFTLLTSTTLSKTNEWGDVQSGEREYKSAPIPLYIPLNGK